MAFRAGAGTFARRLANLCHGSGKQQQGLPPLFFALTPLPFSPMAAMRHGSRLQHTAVKHLALRMLVKLDKNLVLPTQERTFTNIRIYMCGGLRNVKT